MRIKTATAFCMLAVFSVGTPVLAQVKYQPNWASIDSRPVPTWYQDAKFGIFIHWGLYSVPAWGPKGQYAEWYWSSMQDHNGPTWKHHVAAYGEKFQYQDFASAFKAELFQPDQWADVFSRSGAKYVVLTSKHHEGYCLWPSAESWNWNSVDTGPHRDLCGDLTKAVRAKGLKMGFYYSLYEWFNPTYRSNPKRYVEEHMLPQIKDLVTRYQPALIFADGEWEHPSETWRSVEFLSWLFNDGPNRDEVVVNDRWGKETRSRHGGYYTTEYGSVGGDVKLAASRTWEECRGIGASFGYNRNEDIADYKNAAELLGILTETVSKGGNLLLDIGPTADGSIPTVMQERLLEMGDWLKVNGEAIYSTHAWRESAEQKTIRYTAKGNDVYAIVQGWPGKRLTLTAPKKAGTITASLLGSTAPVKAESVGGSVKLELPDLAPDKLPCKHLFVFKLSGVQ